MILSFPREHRGLWLKGYALWFFFFVFLGKRRGIENVRSHSCTGIYMNFHGNMLGATYSPVQYRFLICRCLARIANESFTYSEVEQHSHRSDAISFYWPLAPEKFISQEIIYFLRCSTWLSNKFWRANKDNSRWQQRAMHWSKWRKMYRATIVMLTM